MAELKRPRKAYKRLRFEDRKHIEKLYAEGKTVDEMALIIGVHSTTMYRELEKGGEPYSAEIAQQNVYTAAEKTLANLQKRTALKSLKNSYSLSDIDVYSDHSVKVSALITNQDPVTKQTLVSQGYYINEIGLYAKPAGESGDEVLYSIAVTSGENGDFMPPYNGYNPAQITQDYFATVNNSAEVTINSTGAALLAEDANKLRDDTTKQKYKIGIDNGLVYIQEVDE